MTAPEPVDDAVNHAVPDATDEATDDVAWPAWVLTRSRSMFFAKNRIPQQSFWRFLFEATRQQKLVSDPRNAPVMDWVPESSNCPDLQESVQRVVSRLPPGPGRDAARQVFVGRVIHGQVNAMSWARGHAAGVEVTLQFSNVIVAYLDALRLFLRALREGTTALMAPEGGTQSRDQALTSLQEELIHQVWARLEQDRTGWQDASRLAPVTSTTTAADGTIAAADREDLVADVERFAVAHELAHLLLGHRTDGLAADEALLLTTREVLSECGIDLDAVTGEQCEELVRGAPPRTRTRTGQCATCGRRSASLGPR
jgi:hypothetical protein